MELQNKIVSVASSNVKHLWFCFLGASMASVGSSTM
jgi:hypothetical protein